MPKDPSKLQARPLSAQELEAFDSKKKKAITIEWLKQQFYIPDTDDHGQPIIEDGQPKRHLIRVGEGIELGPFDSEAEGRNWLKYYLPETYKELEMGKEKQKGGHTKPPLSSEPRKRDGQVFMWIVRVRE